MQLKTKVGLILATASSGLILQGVAPMEAIAQELDQESNRGSELELSDIRAFGVATDTSVHSVETLDPASFNDLLLASHRNQSIWANDPL